MTTFKFIHPTAAQVMRVLAIVLTLVDFFLAYADKIQALGWVSPSVAMYWPLIGIVAGACHAAASTFGVQPDATLSTLLSQGLVTAEQVATALTAAKKLPAAPVTTPQP